MYLHLEHPEGNWRTRVAMEGRVSCTSLALAFDFAVFLAAGRFSADTLAGLKLLAGSRLTAVRFGADPSAMSGLMAFALALADGRFIPDPVV